MITPSLSSERLETRTSPYINRFLQPDTIIPDLSNPQTWNRYSYVTNRPVNLSDPTGHRAKCDEGEEAACEQPSPTESLKIRIKNRYKWDVKGDWSLNDLQRIYETGQDIENYINGLVSGKGLAWMNKYMSGVTISRSLINDGMAIPGRIWLPSELNMKGDFGKYYLAHELAHIWDANSSGQIGTLTDSLGAPYGIAGVINGPADGLALFIGGNVVQTNGCRFCDGSGYDHIPQNNRFTQGVMVDDDGRPYGNNSTADYLAESFASSVYSATYPNYVPSLASPWLTAYISIQAASLP